MVGLIPEKILHLDLETTGRHWWEHGIHQVAGIIEIDGKEVFEFDYKVRPHPTSIYDKRALDLGKLTKLDLYQYDRSDIVFPQVLANISQYVDVQDPKDKFFISGYNVAYFDIPFFQRWFFLHNWPFENLFHNAPLDTMALAAEYYIGTGERPSSFSLASVANHLGIHVEKSQLHDAKYDIRLSKELRKFLLNKKSNQRL